MRQAHETGTAEVPQDPAGTTGDDLPDGDLAVLVRRWMAAGPRAHERVRRDGPLRVAPLPAADTAAAPLPTPPPEPVAATTSLVPRLPQRPTGPEVEQASRIAVLIDARRVPADVATGLLARLAERGSVAVCRAYADWGRAELGDWVGRMRREGLHSFHHFPDDDEQALVAMAIDAVDVARDASVDEVVLAGDLTSALPLVHRLHAAGVRVVAVGPGHTPHDVRAACDEFVDTATVDGTPAPVVGRHRA